MAKGVKGSGAPRLPNGDGRVQMGKGEAKLWKSALMVAVNRVDEKSGKKLLALIAERCVLSALQGDMNATREIAERIDGRVQVDMTLQVKKDISEYTDDELRLILLGAADAAATIAAGGEDAAGGAGGGSDGPASVH